MTEFERYCQTRVDIDGKLPSFDPAAATADAEWVKHRPPPPGQAMHWQLWRRRHQARADWHRQRARLARDPKIALVSEPVPGAVLAGRFGPVG